MEEDKTEWVANELLHIKEQLEDFNVIHFEKLILTLKEINFNLSKIANSLFLISQN